MVYICRTTSPAGPMTLSSDGECITGLWFDGQKYYGSTLDRAMLEPDGQGGVRLKAEQEAGGLYKERESLPVFVQVKAWLDQYFEGKEPSFMPPMAPEGSSFRGLVWKILCEIPYGQTLTYGAVAREAASRAGRTSMSAQAVGGAIGHNPISILIPCHRVMGAGGSLTGYAAGVDVKKMLLALEQKGTGGTSR